MRRTLPAFLASSVVIAVALSGCAASDDATSDTTTNDAAAATLAAESSGEWPRTIAHEAGDTTIDEAPLRIVSTSPSITGSLLAIGAPVVASAATTPSALTDDDGFFTQWAEVAHERGVDVAYPDLELDIDAIDLLEPDLIIGSSNGGDATVEAYAQLSEIAPTVMVDYGTVTWQDLAAELGEAVGLEDAAAATVAEYDSWVAEQAELIALPEQPATAFVYLGADGVWAFDETSPQADLLTSLGFDYAVLPEEHLADSKVGANGVDAITSENLASALEGSQTLFAVAMAGGDPVETFVADPLVANLPAVAADRVYSLGAESFRLDYYSARNTGELVVDTFGG
jgi:iron complex transport system substrate-binding protein